MTTPALCRDRGDGRLCVPDISSKIQDQCDKCKKHLLVNGVVHEGYLCYDCGLQAHKTCIAPSYSSVLEHITKHSVLGIGLCSQFDPAERPAPSLLMRLTSELESRARSQPDFDVYVVFKPTSSDSLKSLRKKLNDNSFGSELSEFDSQTIGSALKYYLWELPDPVIPSSVYNDFISAANAPSDLHCAEVLIEIVESLPEHHQRTIR